MNANSIFEAQNIVNGMCANENKKKVKYLKKERGLMEKKEVDEPIILAEDNRQLLFG